MALTNLPNGIASFGMPVLPSFPTSAGFHVPTTGNVYFVDSGTGSDAPGEGTDPDRPFASLDYAVGRTTANQGDLIVAMPGHAESVTAAGGLDLDVAGITILGLGNGNDRPTITLSTATTADIDVDAANIKLINCIIDGTGIADLAVIFDVNAADFHLLNCRVIVGDGTNMADDPIVTAAAADRMIVEGCTFEGDVADGSQTAIDIVGTPDGIRIVNNWFYGDYAEAVIHNASGNVATNMLLAGNYIQQDDATAQAVDLDSAVTGLAAYNLIHTPNIDPDMAATVDYGSLALFENYSVDAVDVQGQLNPVVT